MNKWDETGKKVEEFGHKVENFGNKIGEVGKTLTVVLTIPIIAGVIFGPIGLGIGVVIALLYLAGNKK